MARSRRRDDDNDDDDDDLPRRKSRRRYDDDDDDDDDDDRPRKRLKQAKKKAGGVNPLFIVLGIVGILVVLGGAVAALVALGGFGDTPQGGFDDFQNAITTKNYGRAFDRLDPENQQRISGMMEFVKMDPRMAAHRGKSGRDLFVAVCEEGDKNPGRSGPGLFADWKNAKVLSADQTGETATLTVKKADGGTETMYMKRIDGKWRISPSPVPAWGKW